MLRLGFAEVDITPDRPVELVGFHRKDNRSKGVLKPLLAQAAVSVAADSRITVAGSRSCRPARRLSTRKTPASRSARAMRILTSLPSTRNISELLSAKGPKNCSTPITVTNRSNNPVKHLLIWQKLN